MKLARLLVLLLAFVIGILVGASGNRYQVSSTQPMIMVDRWTGRTWIVSGESADGAKLRWEPFVDNWEPFGR